MDNLGDFQRLILRSAIVHRKNIFFGKNEIYFFFSKVLYSQLNYYVQPVTPFNVTKKYLVFATDNYFVISKSLQPDVVDL